jgi:hypothetical protein
MTRRFIALLLTLGLATHALAETLSCPKLSTAIQIGACPTEEDLKYTFNGYCSDNARMYGKDTDACTDYRQYRRMKNTAAWEAADGTFQAYVSCDLPAASVKSAEASRITAVKHGKITQLVCTYRDGIAFSYRTRAECKVEGDGMCSAETPVCRAICD